MSYSLSLRGAERKARFSSGRERQKVGGVEFCGLRWCHFGEVVIQETLCRAPIGTGTGA